MRAMILQAIDNCNRKMGWWAATVILKYIAIILAFVLYTVVIYRAGGVKASERYEAWKVRYVDDYLTQQEAAKRGMPQDPREELHKQRTEALALVIAGLKEYNYTFEQFVNLGWCIDARTRNPIYSDDMIDVIRQPGQWPGYSENNEVTESDYKMADRVLSVIESAEHPAVSNAFIHASFDRDGITLRDTYEITYKTHFWRYEG